MWIKTKDGWYLHEVRGVCFVSWVSEKDKANATVFPKDKIDGWLILMSDLSGKDLIAVEPHV